MSRKRKEPDIEQGSPVQAYEVLSGLNYDDTRREPGETVTDIPAESIQWLIECGAIRPVESEKE